jgi:drug/metabolite transporter (DMT)-like permease
VARLLLVLGILAISTAAPLVRWAEPAPAPLVAAARVSIAALVLLAIAGRQLGALARLPRRELALCGLSGLLLGIHFGVWIASLYYTSTTASVALVATQPVFAGLLAWMFLGERIARRETLGIALAAVGCALLAGGDLLEASGDALIGDGLALAGAATAAGYFVVGRRLRVALPLSAYLAAVNTVAAVVLCAVVAASATPVTGFAGHAYLAMVLAALVPSVIGHSLLNWTVRRVPVHLVALAILGEPVGASLLSWLLFAEMPPAHAALGGAVILTGIAVGFARLPRNAVGPPGVD